tara:strand:+ start:772 stop:897 length:126 start_codon:yes stop_codon:yes gene_type:complete
MSEYTPDSWVVLKVKEGKGTFPFYKVLAGWSGVICMAPHGE